MNGGHRPQLPPQPLPPARRLPHDAEEVLEFGGDGVLEGAGEKEGAFGGLAPGIEEFVVVGGEGSPGRSK